MAKNNRDNAEETRDLGDILGVQVISQSDAGFQPDFDNVEDIPVIEPEEEPYCEPRQQKEPISPKAVDVGDSLSADDIAIIAVNMVDGLQQFGFTLARKKILFTPEEQQLLPSLDPNDKKTIYPDGSPEAIAMTKLRKHLEVVKNLPFNKEEKARLTSASIIYARTVNLKVSPLTGLVMAFSEVIGTRALTVFND